MTFQSIARQAVRRLFVSQWIGWLGRTAAPVCLAAAAAALGAWLCKVEYPRAGAAAGLVATWIAATGCAAWLRRPTPMAAMARWDAQAGRQEMFISAFCFEALPADALAVGERLHLLRARRALPEAAARLSRDFALPWKHRCWLPPLLLAAVILLLPPARPLPAGESVVDAETRAAARQVSATLAQRTRLPETTKGLSGDETKQLKKLQQAIEETAEHLGNLDKTAQRDVLGELEQRAHEAEKLAEDLQGEDDWPSSKMIDELERHADTAEFAAGLRAKSLDKSADEAHKLGDRLEHKDLSLEERKRIEHALGKSLDAGEKKDKQGLVGKHLDEAHKELKAERPKPAGRQLKQLARRLSERQQRQNAQKQLQQVANQLRSAGQQIFGQQSAGIRRLTQNQDAPAGLRMIDQENLQPGNMALADELAAIPASQCMGLLGLPQAGDPGTPMAVCPVPGALGDVPGSMSPVPGGGTLGLCGQIPVPARGSCRGLVRAVFRATDWAMAQGATARDPCPARSARRQAWAARSPAAARPRWAIRQRKPTRRRRQESSRPRPAATGLPRSATWKAAGIAKRLAARRASWPPISSRRKNRPWPMSRCPSPAASRSSVTSLQSGANSLNANPPLPPPADKTPHAPRRPPPARRRTTSPRNASSAAWKISAAVSAAWSPRSSGRSSAMRPSSATCWCRSSRRDTCSWKACRAWARPTW